MVSSSLLRSSVGNGDRYLVVSSVSIVVVVVDSSPRTGLDNAGVVVASRVVTRENILLPAKFLVLVRLMVGALL